MIAHHPQDDLLYAHAAGSLDAAMALIVATHLHFCVRCRAEVALGEQVGGVLLQDYAPAPLAADAWSLMLARLDAPQAQGAHKIGAHKIGAHKISQDNTPTPLRAFMGRDLSAVRWRKLGPHLAYAPLWRSGATRVRLLRGAPGSDTGRHSHKGLEYTQVLAGGFTDETGSYGPGDFQCASAEVSHNPVADNDGEDCINLAVTTDSLRFEGWIPTIVGKLFGF